MSALELIIMTGGAESSAEERMMTGAWQAATLDWLDRAEASADVGQVFLATNSPAFAAQLKARNDGLEVSVDAAPFHFGQRIRDIILTRRLEKPLYVGAGSGVLLTEDEVQYMARTLESGERLLVTNNFYSSDFVAFTPGDAIRSIEPPDTDNDLAWRLGRQAGLRALALPPSATTQFDLDTPVDLMIAKAHPRTARHLRASLNALSLDSTPVLRALEALRRPGASIFIGGRVGAAVREFAERELQCQVSAFAEERGMRASGREERGEARSILGHFMQEYGAEALFGTMAAKADLVLLDSRVILSHFGKWPSNTDRFRSDLMRYEEIEDPVLRALTEAAAHARVPVVLGGHSLVSGGLYALIEVAKGQVAPGAA